MSMLKYRGLEVRSRKAEVQRRDGPVGVQRQAKKEETPPSCLGRYCLLLLLLLLLCTAAAAAAALSM